MPDLVGVVIPAYIGAFSSLAGVVVAIVALVTARRARADARSASSDAARTAERQQATRDAVVELAGLIAPVPDAAAAASPPSVAPPSTKTSRRPRLPQETGERRPYWAAKPGAGPSSRTDQPTAEQPDELRRRIAAVLRRLDD